MSYLSLTYLKRTCLVEVSSWKEYGRCYKRLEPGRCVEGSPSTRSGSLCIKNKIMSLDSTELTRRKSVWMALSEFYLDTELTSNELTRIHLVLVESGYSEKEILEINYNEVAPVLIANTWSTAGVWGGFDEQWVIDSITKRVNKKPSKLQIPGMRWIANRHVDFFTKAYFRQVFPI